MLSQDKQWLLEEKYGGEKSSAFFADCERLAAGEPLGYVIGHVPFLGCTIHLDNRPLIPRPETEWWVERAIATIKQNHPEDRPREFPRPVLGMTSEATPRPLRVLDLCAGSGAIGITVAKHLPTSHVTFGEIDEHLRHTIFKNLEANDIDCTRYQVFTSNLFTHIPLPRTVLGTKDAPDTYVGFDFILSNPPYIDPALDRAEDSVKHFEPHQALYGGTDGMELIEHIITEAPDYLTPHGQLWLEHEPEQSATIQELAAKHSFTTTTHTDQYGTERYSVLVLE